MEVVEISEENLEDFLPILGEDLGEDLKRIYYRGLGAADDDGNPLGAMVCELVNADTDEENVSRIHFLSSDSKETADALQGFYRQNTVEDEGISESFYELAGEETAKLLEEAGFSCEKKESEALLLTLEDLSDTKMAKAKTPPEYIRSVEALTILQYRDAIKQILFKGHRGVLEDIPYLPMNWFDGRVSACAISGDKAPGLFLIRRTPSGILIPVLYFAYGSDSKKYLLYMLQYAIQTALQCYPPETPVMILRRTSSIKALSANLFPGHKGDEVFSGIRKE